MWKRAGVVLLWVMATVGTASITLAAVSRVGGEVTEQAAVPINSSDLVATTAVSAPTGGGNVQTAPAGGDTTTTTFQDSTTSSSPAIAASDDTAPRTEDATTTTSIVGPETTSTTTSAPPTTTQASYLDTRGLIGGSVTVQVSGESVTLVSAIPAGSGWTVKVKDDGPDEVSVEFESETHESRYKAEVSSGELVVTIEEEEEGGGGGEDDDD